MGPTTYGCQGDVKLTVVAEPDGRGVEMVHTDGWTATPSAALFSAFLLLAASSGSNTRVALIPFILLIIWATNYIFSFLYFRRFNSTTLTKQLQVLYSLFPTIT
jgi:hypothetical protein